MHWASRIWAGAPSGWRPYLRRYGEVTPKRASRATVEGERSAGAGGRHSRAGRRSPESPAFITAVLAAGVTSLTGRIARNNSMTGKQGQTALFQAVEAGRADVVRYLLQHGASPDIKDDAGRTPGAVARSKEIAALLPPAGGSSR